MFPTCQVDVFQRAPGSEYHKDEKPSNAAITTFYRRVVLKQHEKLDILVRQAAQINLNLR